MKFRFSDSFIFMILQLLFVVMAVIEHVCVRMYVCACVCVLAFVCVYVLLIFPEASAIYFLLKGMGATRLKTISRGK